MLDGSTHKIVEAYLAKVAAAGVPVARCVVFGSHARGEQTAQSDIDLLVIAPVFDGKGRQAAIDTLWCVAWRVDDRIEPIGVGVREFKKKSWVPLLMVARQEGVVVYPAAQTWPRVAAEGKATYRIRRCTRKEVR